MLQEDIRTISHQLYPFVLRYGLVPALQSLGDIFEDTLTIEFQVDEELVRQEREDRRLVPEEVRLAVYRIAEEALGNVVKHAEASSRVVIRPELTPEGSLRLTVRDDGRGFDSKDTSPGLGMAAMEDYAEAAGGARVVRSVPGNGTEVIATLPVGAQEAER